MTVNRMAVRVRANLHGLTFHWRNSHHGWPHTIITVARRYM
jgi:hypothetical protein